MFTNKSHCLLYFFFMALKCASSSQSLIQKSRLFHFQDCKQRFNVPFPLRKKTPSRLLRISASFDNNKIYDDETQRIVCYKDETSGEIICEGYDEGPRFPRISTPTYHPRDVEIMNLLLHQSLLQILKGEDTFNPSLQRLCLHQTFNFIASEI